MKIGIIGAMEIEVSELKTLMKENGTLRVVSGCGLNFFVGQLEGLDVVVVKSGIGKVNAALCAQALILRFGVTAIVNTGIAGAIGGGLRVFDVAVSLDALYHDMDATAFGYKLTEIPQMKVSKFPADKLLIDATLSAFEDVKNTTSDEAVKASKCVLGTIATGDVFVSGSAQKAKIKDTTAAICVEMEGAAVAHASYLNTTPFVIIRSISDMADDGAHSSYTFSEERAAKNSAAIVLALLRRIK